LTLLFKKHMGKTKRIKNANIVNSGLLEEMSRNIIQFGYKFKRYPDLRIRLLQKE